jgi:hypothetical protein
VTVTFTLNPKIGSTDTIQKPLASNINDNPTKPYDKEL